MAAEILFRIDAPDATGALESLRGWLEAEAGFTLIPQPAPLSGLPGTRGRWADKPGLLRVERLLSASGSVASIVGLLLIFAPTPESPPQPPDTLGYAELVKGADRLLAGLRELGCDKELSLELVAGPSGDVLKLDVRTAPADVVEFCLRAQQQD